MVTALLGLVIGGQGPAFTSANEGAAKSLMTDAFNDSGIPKALHKEIAGLHSWDTRIQKRLALAKNAYAGLSEAKKRDLRIKLYRQTGIGCLQFIEIHALLKTTAGQQVKIARLIGDITTPFSGLVPSAQKAHMLRQVRIGEDLRSCLTAAQIARLAKYVGGEAYLTAHGGGAGVLYDGYGWYSGGLSDPIIREAIGLQPKVSADIAAKYAALAPKDGTAANRYLHDFERTLTPSQRVRLEQLNLQAQGEISILRGDVASRLGMSAATMESITKENIELSFRRLKAAPQPPAKSNPAKGLEYAKLRTRYANETLDRIAALIRSHLRPAQREEWNRLQGPKLPGISRRERMARL